VGRKEGVEKRQGVANIPRAGPSLTPYVRFSGGCLASLPLSGHLWAPKLCPGEPTRRTWRNKDEILVGLITAVIGYALGFLSAFLLK